MTEPYTTPKKSRRTYTSIEAVFAWLCFLMGYALNRVFSFLFNPFGGFLFILGLFTATIIVLKIKGGRLTGMPLAALLSSLLFATSLLFTANGFLHFLAYAYALAAYCYFVYASLGNETAGGFNDLIILDFFRALIILPFQSFGAIFLGAFSGEGKFNGKFALKIIIGVCVAVVPTAVILILLSYDRDFINIIIRILDFGLSDLLEHLASLILGVPVAMYIYGLFISSADHKGQEICSAENYQKGLQQARIAPILTVCSAVLPILGVYVLFFISQWKYYISGFVGQLPDATSYAEYAREGFFQLCAVSFINFIIIGAIGLFMRRKTEKPSWAQRILSVILSLFTLVLMATAIAKLVLYINVYGLTPKRVYAAWFMGMLAILFVVVIIKQFFLRLKVIAASVAVVICSFAVLVFANTDTLIAEHNVNHYLSGDLDSIDGDALSDLGEAAIPSMVRLVLAIDEQYDCDFISGMNQDNITTPIMLEYQTVRHALYDYAMTSKSTFWSYTIPQLKAEKAIKDCGLAEAMKDHPHPDYW